MPLIDHTYFIGEINLPNTTKADVQERLNFFINKYEEKLLIELLGYDLYKQYKTGLTAQEPESKWLDIRDGAEYTNSAGIMFKWDGLRNEETKKSMIANYVYYWWMRNEVSQTSAVGEVITTTENAVRTSPSVKMSRAWNEMVESSWRLIRFLDAKTTVYYPNSYRYWNSLTQARLSDVLTPLNTLNL